MDNSGIDFKINLEEPSRGEFTHLGRSLSLNLILEINYFNPLTGKIILNIFYIKTQTMQSPEGTER